MSLASWKKEHYPVNAERVEKDDALKHALNKWKGLRPQSLKKHDVNLSNRVHLNGYPIITIRSCALCIHYYPRCFECPLYELRNERCYEGKDNPYVDMLTMLNPEPMIALLEQALDKQIKRE
jgi:hypothetical protein